MVKFHNDCARIVRVAREILNRDISLEQAEVIWGEYSKCLGATWLVLCEDDKLLAECIENTKVDSLGNSHSWLDPEIEIKELRGLLLEVYYNRDSEAVRLKIKRVLGLD